MLPTRPRLTLLARTHIRRQTPPPTACLLPLLQAAEQSVEDMAIEPNHYNNVPLFLGRLQGLPVRRQNLMFAYLTVSYSSSLYGLFLTSVRIVV